MENRPVAAYTLTPIGAVLQAVSALFIIYMVVFFTTIRSSWQEVSPDWMAPRGMGHWVSGRPYTNHPILGFVWLISALLVVRLSILGASLMNSTSVGRVRTDSTLVLMFQ